MGRPKTTFKTSNASFKVYTSAERGTRAILVKDAAPFIGFEPTSLHHVFRAVESTSAGKTEEKIEINGQTRARACLDLRDLRVMRAYYEQPKRSITNRESKLEAVNALIDGLTDFVQATAPEPKDEPQPSEPVNKWNGDPPFGFHMPTAGGLAAALAQTVKASVVEAMESVQMVSEVKLDPSDLKDLRKLVREEVDAALKHHIKAQGGTALSIVSSMNTHRQGQLTFPGFSCEGKPDA